MIYLRDHSRKHLDIQTAAEYLENSYQSLLKAPDNDKIAVDRVFNRNAFALVLYKRGEIESAQKMIELGLKHLSNIPTTYSKFHQSILYYNLFQCLAAQGASEEAVATMEHLIGMDAKFFIYYEFLADFYIFNFGFTFKIF